MSDVTGTVWFESSDETWFHRRLNYLRKTIVPLSVDHPDVRDSIFGFLGSGTPSPLRDRRKNARVRGFS
jgi:hypothetical protein